MPSRRYWASLSAYTAVLFALDRPVYRNLRRSVCGAAVYIGLYPSKGRE